MAISDGSPSLLHENHESVSGDHQVETALVGDDYSASIPHVLAAKERSIAVEDLFPPSIGNGQQVLGDSIAVGKRRIVETRDDNDFLVSAPPLEGNNPIGVRLVQDVDIVAADRA